METQDHREPKQSGNEGHSGGGVHVCTKCGWPFPNPHPSARHRRAHKKVCGTIEGHRLDNDKEGKTHLVEGSDGEHVSDYEHKTPSGKVVERTISRRSSSGVGSRSSRSTRSEDEMFSDAVTEFTDTPAPGDGLDGGIQRFYSLQRVTESDLDDTKLTAEDAVADNFCAHSILLKDNQDQVQPVQKLEGGNDRIEEDDQDQISSSISGSALVLASITTVEDENKGNTADESKEILSSKEKSERRILFDETTEEVLEDVSCLRAVNEEIQGHASAGEIAKSTGIETTGSENSIECSQVVEHPVEVIDPANGSSTKLSDVMEDHGSKTGAIEDVYVPAVPEALPLQKHPDTVVEDLDLKRGKSNTLKAPGSVLESENVEYGIAHAAEELSFGIDLTETSDSKKVYSENDILESVDAMENKLDQDVGQKSMAEHNPVGEPGQLLDVEASDADISKLRCEVVSDLNTANLEDKKVSCAEDYEEDFISLENVVPESASSVAADILESTSNRAANSSDSVKNYTEHVVLQGIGNSDIPPQVKELSNINDSSGTGNDGNIGVVQIHLDKNEMRNGGENNEALNAKTVPSCGLSAAGSHDGIHEPSEQDRIHDHGKLDKMVDSGDVMVGHLLPKVECSGGSSGKAKCIGEDGAILKIDGHPGSKMISSDALEVCDDAQCSAAANNTCLKIYAEEASCVVEGDGIVKPQVAVSAADFLPDSSSQTDSLEGNWGSVSVMSAVSDTPSAYDTPVSNQSQASAAKDNASLELKPETESQHSESKTSVEPYVGIGTMEGVSEIQTLEEQREKSSALQTSWSSSVAHLDNAQHGGKRNEEITAKVTNWSTEKQHTPLKTLLGEATARSRAESPIHTQMIPPQTDEIPEANNGFSKTENVILSSNNPTLEASKEEMGKEWNSPARYPVNIKTEKRKAKGRPYWAPFLCCSSVNAR